MTYLQVQWCVSEIHQIETIRVNANESTLMNNLSTKHPSTYITFSETKQTNQTASEERPVVQCKQSIHAWPLDVQDCSLIFSFPYHFILRLKSRWSAVCKLFYIQDVKQNKLGQSFILSIENDWIVFFFFFKCFFTCWLTLHFDSWVSGIMCLKLIKKFNCISFDYMRKPSIWSMASCNTNTTSSRSFSVPFQYQWQWQRCAVQQNRKKSLCNFMQISLKSLETSCSILFYSHYI